MLKVENTELKSEVKKLKIQNALQDDQIVLLKKQISHLESILPSTLAAYNSNTMGNGAATNNEPSTKSLSSPPSTCQELIVGNGLVHPVDGVHLLKNGNKIQAVFCTFNQTSCSKIHSSFIVY